jgi:hypothetical protein
VRGRSNTTWRCQVHAEDYAEALGIEGIEGIEEEVRKFGIDIGSR